MEANNTIITVQEKNVTEEVLWKVKDLNKKGELLIPSSYSPENALKSAWIILKEAVDSEKKPVLQSCSKSSIANALLNMVIQGLSPSKRQCYFVAYGGKLELMRSLMGTLAVTKRLKGVKDVKAHVIYENDEFEQEYSFDTATLEITKFNPKFENIDTTKIKGAFAVVLGETGPLHTEVMNIGQLKKIWGKSLEVYLNYAEEMAKKTVINIACKIYTNTSDDSDVLIEAFNSSEVEEDGGEVLKENPSSKIIDLEEKKAVVQGGKVLDGLIEQGKAEISKDEQDEPGF